MASISPSRRAWQRFKRNRLGYWSLVLFCVLVVLSLCAELQAPDRARCHCLPWLDLVPASPVALRRAAAVIDRAVRRGDPVVVGCALGFSRSAAALACWLARSGRAADAESALRQLRRVHPQMVLNADWQASLRQAVRT